MTKDDARRLCLRVMATQLEEQGVRLNADWPQENDQGEPYSDADTERIRDAARTLSEEWRRRAGQ